VVPSNTVLDRALVSLWKVRFGGRNPPVHIDATYCQITLSVVIIVFITA